MPEKNIQLLACCGPFFGWVKIFRNTVGNWTGDFLTIPVEKFVLPEAAQN